MKVLGYRNVWAKMNEDVRIGYPQLLYMNGNTLVQETE